MIGEQMKKRRFFNLRWSRGFWFLASLWSEREDGMDGVGDESGTALEEGEFDEHRDADEVGAEFVEQFDGGRGGAAGGEQIVD